MARDPGVENKNNNKKKTNRGTRYTLWFGNIYKERDVWFPPEPFIYAF